MLEEGALRAAGSRPVLFHSEFPWNSCRYAEPATYSHHPLCPASRHLMHTTAAAGVTDTDIACSVHLWEDPPTPRFHHKEGMLS